MIEIIDDITPLIPLSLKGSCLESHSEERSDEESVLRGG
ncbi:MAG: hypothetical protein HW402_1303 [Dehalococcoidales bacterium]|nr:hypothetical protein [Dehalococcoidales bacterium]